MSASFATKTQIAIFFFGALVYLMTALEIGTRQGSNATDWAWPVFTLIWHGLFVLSSIKRSSIKQ